MSARFQYHAQAVGVSGRIVAPVDPINTVQASAALPESGGFGTARTDNFSFQGVVSFAAAYSVVAGSYSPKDQSYDALASVTIEGLNVLSVVTADRIVARMSSMHPEKGPHRIDPTGTYFENLRIAGQLVEVDLATDTFSRFANADQVRQAYRDNENGFRDEFHRLSLLGQEERIPERHRAHFPFCGRKPDAEIPESHGIIACSLARGIRGLPARFGPCGHVVAIPGFGTIRLGEFKITSNSAQISMLEISLGSTPVGSCSVAAVRGNGSPW